MNGKPKILLVEDEVKLHQLVKHALENASFEVFSAYDGDVAMALFKETSFDLVVLDVMLPKTDGWRLLKTFKEKNIPVIMATARALEDDKLFGFDLGADDYLTKPFSLKELIARIHVLLRRHQPSKLQEVGILKVDAAARSCFVDHAPVTLSLKEFDLLTGFLAHPNQALTREQLLNTVWGYDYFGDTRTVDTHVKRLRQKIAPFDGIKTVHGVGYRLEVSDV